ncbi:hypothetical protein MKQ68_05510 [Chitinophaga horti]|uniref:Uncharacterized protein n=1 Tax=Chitinophaga horti TaxID=2920382 RepID=A0ABY6J8B3_9BACT|nr:hypothetical protein [Chitinophaga horti]UYQ94547.1 hypothetical protein MKQ68_05510 [Chitinophaga horti]
MVEHEDVRVNYYFALNNSVVRLQASDLRLMPSLAAELEPLRVTGSRLFSLQFTPVFGSNNTIWEKAFNGLVVRLKATSTERWTVELDKTGKIRYVQYVHELQDLWRGLFDEPLQRRVGDVKVETPIRQLRPDYRVTPPDKSGGGYPRAALISPRPQQFYITWDCLYVMSTLPLVVWKVVEDDAYYSYAGRKWGFQCVYGKVDKKLTDKMAEWVKGELVDKGAKR